MTERATRSGLAQAGEILLLVGWIVRAVTLLLVLVYLVWLVPMFSVLFDAAANAENAEDAEALGSLAGLMLVLMLIGVVVAVASVVVGIIAWQKARAGQYRTPGILAIILSMLPPVDLIFLLGGIFLLVCDEAKTEQADARAATQADVNGMTRHE